MDIYNKARTAELKKHLIEMNNKYQYQKMFFQIQILYFNMNKYKTFLNDHLSEIALSFFHIKPGGLFEK